MSIHWKADKQYFTMVLFVYASVISPELARANLAIDIERVNMVTPHVIPKFETFSRSESC